MAFREPISARDGVLPDGGHNRPPSRPPGHQAECARASDGLVLPQGRNHECRMVVFQQVPTRCHRPMVSGLPMRCATASRRHSWSVAEQVRLFRRQTKRSSARLLSFRDFREIPNRVLRWVIALLKYGVSGVGMSFIGPEKEKARSITSKVNSENVSVGVVGGTIETTRLADGCSSFWASLLDVPPTRAKRFPARSTFPQS